MGLTVITGHANAGKTGLAHSRVRAALEEGRGATLLVPSGPDAVRAAAEFAREGLGLGLEVATFDDHLSSLWALHGDGRRVVGGAQRTLLLRAATERAGAAGPLPSALRPGFVCLMERIAEHLTDDFRPSGNGLPGILLRVMSCYSESLREERLVERSAAQAGLAEAVAAAWYDGPLVVNRFTDFTPHQERYLLSAARRGVDVRVALPWEEGAGWSEALRPLVGRLLAEGERVEARAEGHTPSRELREMASALFAGGGRLLASSGDVRFSEAFGEEAEAELIAAEVSEALENGMESVAVVFRDPERNAARVELALAAVGIEAAFDLVVPVSATPLGRALLHLAEFASSGSRVALLGWLRSPFSGATVASVEDLDRAWRSSRERDAETLVRGMRRIGEEQFRTVGTARRLWGIAVDDRSAEAWKKLADGMLRHATLASGGAEGTTAEADASAHAAFTRCLSETAALRTAAPSACDLFTAFSRMRVASRSLEGRGVEVLSAQRARSRRFDTVIIADMTEGGFSVGSAETVLSSPRLSEALLASGLDLRRMDEWDADRLTFYLVATRARRRLVLSRQVADLEGNPLRPSALLGEVLDLYRPVGEDDALAGVPIRRVGYDAPGECAITEGHRSRRRRLRDEAGARAARSPVTHALSPDVAAAAFADIAFSATALERYIACPYAWFRERAVAARGLDQELDRSAQGSLIHAALREFYGELEEALGKPRVTPDGLEAALGLAGDVASRVVAAQPPPESVREEAAYGRVVRKVVGLVEADARFLPGFRPFAHEHSFGTEEGPPLEVDGLPLRGRIDRIDVDDRGNAVVIDYKSGEVGPAYAHAAFERRGRVQLPLYAEIVERTLGLRVVGVLYRGVSAGNLSGKQNRGYYLAEAEGPGLAGRDLVGEERAAEIRAEALRRATAAAEGIRRGEIAPRPLQLKVCERCAYTSMCGRAACG